VVTPLPPFETFKDDPLRVLRAVRFAHRFQFEVDPAIASAASHPIIVEALVCKVRAFVCLFGCLAVRVSCAHLSLSLSLCLSLCLSFSRASSSCRQVSRERFGKEVEGMLKRWRSFPAALRELHGMGLLPLLLTTDAAATAAEAQAKVAATSASASASASVANDAAAAEAPSAGKEWGAALDALDWLTLLLLDTSQQQPQATASTPAKAADEEEEQGNTKAVDVASLARTAMLAGAVLPLAGKTVMTGKKRNKPSRAAAVALLVRTRAFIILLVLHTLHMTYGFHFDWRFHFYYHSDLLLLLLLLLSLLFVACPGCDDAL
jgi:tRNA nucleotidyltransferase/poly(A) polymerase